MTARLDLNGTWKLGCTDGVRGMVKEPHRPDADDFLFLDAVVPGEVHLDLMRHGLIGEPSVGLNALGARWVEEHIWWYRRTFEAPAEALGGRAWLVFEQLDLAATIALNGEVVATHSNVWRPLRVEVTGKLREGTNVLSVEIESGIFAGAEHTTDDVASVFDMRLHRRVWLRKPSYQFGWDWSTRYLTVGIGGNVSLEHTTGAVRVDELVPLVDVSRDLSSATVRARVFAEGLDDTPVSSVLTASVCGVTATAEVTIRPGLHPYEITIEIPDPQLWWPSGFGEPVMHELTAELDGQQRSTHIGLRRVRVNEDPHPAGGRFFVLEVNNTPIFCKGGNWAPADMILCRLDRDRYEELLDAALEANYNFFRINGVGTYESDDFYDLCDRKGIMIMQDFTLSCGRYPAFDQAWIDEFRREAGHQVRRLAPHPSLVVWCGSNENEWIYWDTQRNALPDAPDRQLYRLTIPEVLADQDPTRPYIPSSPYSPDGLFPNADEAGDQHPWSVGMGNWDFRDYRTMACRFPDEGGLLGPTSLPTMVSCLQDRNDPMGSFSWFLHDNTMETPQPSGVQAMTELHTGIALRGKPIAEYVYWAGLIRGEGLREYAENFRRRKFDTASAVYWSYNDCWPTTSSWALVDYYGRRMPAFHPVRRAMAPVHVVVALDGDDVVVFGVNDTLRPVDATIRYGLFGTKGGLHLDKQMDVHLAANASTRLTGFPRSDWADPSSTIAFATLEAEEHPPARSRLILPLYRELAWAEPKVSVEIADGRAVFTSDAFAWGVCIDLDGGPEPADNFFDVWPEMPYSIPWTKSEVPEILYVGNLSSG